MEKNLIKKINDIDNVSDSQKDRMNQQLLIQDDLIDFLSAQIKIVKTKDELYDSVVAKLKERVDDTEEEIPTMVLMRLLELLDKGRNEFITSVKPAAPVMVSPVGGDGSRGKSSEFTKEEIGKTKKLLDMLDLINRIENSELSIDEIENKKK